MQAFYSITEAAVMRANRISSSDEQFRLIMECGQSGLSDYQWCQANEINPGSFNNWINRLRKRGMVIPCTMPDTVPTVTELQEVIKVDLIPDNEFMPQHPIPNDCPNHNPTAISLKDPVAEILLGNSTIRFFQDADRELIEATFQNLENNAYSG